MRQEPAIKYFFLFALLVLLQCRNHCSNDVIIESEKLFDSIPSGSGLVIKNCSAYIVGDDGTGLYRVTLSHFKQEKIAINGVPFSEYREPKEIKHDFESACLVKWKGKEYLLAFGSGSYSTWRDSMLLLNTGNYADQKIVSLHQFYKHLQSLTDTDSTQWNIEGLAAADDFLVIANRANNMLMSFDSDKFLSYILKPGQPLPPVHYFTLQLPFIGTHEARLSGLCTIDNTNLLFCASVEDTPDWTKDGPVLGSYFGICSLDDKKTKASFLLKDSKKKPLKEKIESIDILSRSNKAITLLAVSDNDNGTSKLWQINLNYK